MIHTLDRESPQSNGVARTSHPATNLKFIFHEHFEYIIRSKVDITLLILLSYLSRNCSIAVIIYRVHPIGGQFYNLSCGGDVLEYFISQMGITFSRLFNPLERRLFIHIYHCARQFLSLYQEVQIVCERKIASLNLPCATRICS